MVKVKIEATSAASNIIQNLSIFNPVTNTLFLRIKFEVLDTIRNGSAWYAYVGTKTPDASYIPICYPIVLNGNDYSFASNTMQLRARPQGVYELRSESWGYPINTGVYYLETVIQLNDKGLLP